MKLTAGDQLGCRGPREGGGGRATIITRNRSVRFARAFVVGANGEAEGRALGGLALDGDRATHEFAEAFGNDQAEAGAAATSRGRCVHLAEGAEELAHFFRRDADAGVGHGEEKAEFATVLVFDHRAASAGECDGDAAVLGKLDGVADQVNEDLAQAVDVAVDESRNVIVDFGFEH